MEITDELQQEIELLIEDNQKLRREYTSAMELVQAQQGLLGAYQRLFVALAAALVSQGNPQVRAALVQFERDVHQQADSQGAIQ